MAAGLGFKTFATGDVLTAADTNGYLMQGVLVFASAATRDAAITAPQAGQTAYLKDSNTIVSYSGSAWVTKSGGSPLTTKGDLYGYSTVDARVAVGTNGTVLTADSTVATGVAWATGSGMTSLATGSLSGSSVSITSISGSYNSLRLVIMNWRPSGANTNLLMQFNTDTGTNYVSEAGYTFSTDASAAATSLRISGGTSATTDTGQLVIDMPSYASTAVWKFTQGAGYTTPGSGATTTRSAWVNGIWTSATAITSIQLILSAGTHSAGTYTLYGVK
jgi:hypothetical protein